MAPPLWSPASTRTAREVNHGLNARAENRLPYDVLDMGLHDRLGNADLARHFVAAGATTWPTRQVTPPGNACSI